MFLTDDGGHFVRKVTLDGKVLPELSVPGKPAPFMSDEPFHRCTHTALSPQGEMRCCVYGMTGLQSTDSWVFQDWFCRSLPAGHTECPFTFSTQKFAGTRMRLEQPFVRSADG
jgi:hypothetical protein